MKKSLRLATFSLLALTFLLISTVAPVLGAGLTLLSVEAKRSRGLVLTFDTGGDYSGAISGMATVGWSSYPMYCANGSAGKLVCFIGSGIYKHAGKNAVVSIGGQTFNVGIPSRGTGSLPSWWCLEFPQDRRCR